MNILRASPAGHSKFDPQMSADAPDEYPGVSVLTSYLFIHAAMSLTIFLYTSGHMHVIGEEEEKKEKEKEKEKERKKMLCGAPNHMWRTQNH
jgi:hypothetical protein